METRMQAIRFFLQCLQMKREMDSKDRKRSTFQIMRLIFLIIWDIYQPSQKTLLNLRISVCTRYTFYGYRFVPNTRYGIPTGYLIPGQILDNTGYSFTSLGSAFCSWTVSFYKFRVSLGSLCMPRKWVSNWFGSMFYYARWLWWWWGVETKAGRTWKELRGNSHEALFSECAPIALSEHTKFGLSSSKIIDGATLKMLVLCVSWFERKLMHR